MLKLALQLGPLFRFQKFEQTMVNLIFDTMDLYYGMKLAGDLRFQLPIHLKENYLCISFISIKLYFVFFVCFFVCFLFCFVLFFFLIYLLLFLFYYIHM